MLNNILLNNGLLGNAGADGIIKSAGASFSFNGFSLDNGSTRRVIASNHDNLGSVNYDTFDYPRDNGGDGIARYYRTKTINIKISVKANSKEELNDEIDLIKQATSKMKGNLDIIINGIVRRYEATITAINFNREAYNVDWLGNIDLTFNCVNPLAYSVNNESETYSEISGNFISEINYNGVAGTYPTFYMLFDNALGVNSIELNVNGYALKINSPVNSGDVLIFDGEKKLIMNGQDSLYYRGVFPLFESGVNHIEFKFNEGALVNYTAVVIYKKKYL